MCSVFFFISLVYEVVDKFNITQMEIINISDWNDIKVTIYIIN